MRTVKDLFFGTKKLSQERFRKLQNFCQPLGLRFRNYELLDLAFHHRSYSNENENSKRYNNERLEFLGDSVLGVVTAAFLYDDMENNPEGDLARIKSVVVSEQTLAPIALRFGISDMLILGHGEEISGGRTKSAILADCMEAVIGAYYLDSGYAAVNKYILSFIVPEIRKVQQNRGIKDYKTMLQELYQKTFKCCPRYELVSRTGPDHDQTFKVSVHLQGVTYGPAVGKSKKQAEQSAAHEAWSALTGQAE